MWEFLIVVKYLGTGMRSTLSLASFPEQPGMRLTLSATSLIPRTASLVWDVLDGVFQTSRGVMSQLQDLLWFSSKLIEPHWGAILEPVNYVKIISYMYQFSFCEVFNVYVLTMTLTVSTLLDVVHLLLQ